MGKVRVKICCIKNPEEMQLAIELGADALGLVGAMPSGPGVIDDQMAAQIAGMASPPISTFLLTSETTGRGIKNHVDQVHPSTVQIVSHIDVAAYAELDQHLPRHHVKRVQVIHVEDDQALDLIDLYAPHVDAFLLDSGKPSATTPELGGTGRVHDWDISAEFVRRSPLPVFLAGGLKPENVGEAIRKVRPFGLDLCSGVRTDDQLDRQKLTAFMDAVRAAEAAEMG
ncbi:MAG: phosphoribosylanthranilate isomerase [Alphaproteobacteria bacterium]|nr:phosphoribosylanthranilate isomerase [Alphaproteobacteria bacterium SS10]